jgi:hypothetical protein
VDLIKRKNLQNRKSGFYKAPVTVSSLKNRAAKVWYLDKAAPIPGANPKVSVG